MSLKFGYMIFDTYLLMHQQKLDLDFRYGVKNAESIS